MISTSALITRLQVLGAGIDEVKEASAAIKFGEENGGVGLRFRRFHPLKARSYCAVFAAAFSENPASIATHSHGYQFFH